MAWFARGLVHSQAGFFRRSITFAIVAAHTGADEIFPSILASARTRVDVVDRQWRSGRAAIRTAMTVAAQDVLARKLNFDVGETDVSVQADDAGEGPHAPNGANLAVVIFNDNFGFAQKDEDDGFLDAANADWFVTLVEDKDPFG